MCAQQFNILQNKIENFFIKYTQKSKSTGMCITNEEQRLQGAFEP